MDRHERVAAFGAQASRIGSTVHQAAPEEVPGRLAQIVRDANCRSVALAREVAEQAPIVEALSNSAVSLVSTRDLWPTRRADGGISVARLGVAETGSTLLHSTSEDRRVELCVDVHIVLLDAALLVSTLDSAFMALRAISAKPPAYASLVSGPSRSADIERQITIGVHGPRALHVLLIESRA